MTTEETEEHKRLIAELAEQLAEDEGYPEIKVLGWRPVMDRGWPLMLKNESTQRVDSVVFSDEEIDNFKSEFTARKLVKTRLRDAIRKLGDARHWKMR